MLKIAGSTGVIVAAGAPDLGGFLALCTPWAAKAPYFAQVHELLVKRPGARAQMLIRLGYAARVGLAPRYPVGSPLMAKPAWTLDSSRLTLR